MVQVVVDSSSQWSKAHCLWTVAATGPVVLVNFLDS